MSDVADIENIIFSSILNNHDYPNAVLPHLKEEYFTEPHKKIVHKLISKHFEKYNCAPTLNELKVELDEDDIKLSQKLFESCLEYVEIISPEVEVEYDWLIEKTEKFCQERAIYNGIMESIKILNNEDKEQGRGSIPKILSDALGISFDNSIGHDFVEDSDARFEFYKRKEERIPFDIEYFNLITRGGIPNKTLNVLIAGTAVGKTLVMCHMAAANIINKKNVLYITLEMSEERIAERIDANLLNIPISALEGLEKLSYVTRINALKDKSPGKLIIKEYPTASVSASHFRHLLHELKTKKKFVPDIIYIDYINICASSRLKMGASVNSYTYIKAIAEELRGLAVEHNLPIFTATQTNRSGFASSDPEMTDTAESFGLPQTVDFMFAAVNSEQLEDLGYLMFKQLKNRYNDPSFYKRFVVGVDRPKMKLFNVKEEEQDRFFNKSKDDDKGGDDDVPVFDKTHFGGRTQEERLSKVKSLFGG